MENVNIIASPQSWIEGAAVEQLKQTAQLPGMKAVWGLPDLHPGKGSPIGATYLNQDTIYPHLVGNDIGCGMALWQSELGSRKLKIERWMQKLQGLEGPWEGDLMAYLQDASLSKNGFESSLGTIGGGNHFAELQILQNIQDPDALDQLDLTPDQLCLLIHSGSRGLGESILRAQVDQHGAKGLNADSEDAIHYLAQHDQAVAWAQVNRQLIAERFLEALNTSGSCKLDLCHNHVIAHPQGWLHRKGAAPSDQGFAVVPGSRGSLSYLVKPIPSERSGWSIAHGAGRKWTRHDSKARLKDRFRPEDLHKTSLGSWVICQNHDLLYEEAPQAYKSIDQVVKDLVDAEIVTVVAELRPLITYKTRRQS